MKFTHERNDSQAKQIKFVQQRVLLEKPTNTQLAKKTNTINPKTDS